MNTVIESLDQYVEFIQTLDKSYVLSRGQEYDKPLLPSVMKLDGNRMRFFLMQQLRNLLMSLRIIRFYT